MSDEPSRTNGSSVPVALRYWTADVWFCLPSTWTVTRKNPVTLRRASRVRPQIGTSI